MGVKASGTLAGNRVGVSVTGSRVGIGVTVGRMLCVEVGLNVGELGTRVLTVRYEVIMLIQPTNKIEITM
jgi:hypothetical protein